MSDYLGNLAARSLDPAGAAVRPRLASRFEPVAPWAAPLAAESAGEMASLETAEETAAAPARPSRAAATPLREPELPEPVAPEPLPAPPRRRRRGAEEAGAEPAPVERERFAASEGPLPRPSSPRPSSPAPSQPPSPGEEGEQPSPLITPALFSHRPPPDREKREQGQDAPGGPLSRGREQEKSGTGTLLPVPAVLAVPTVPVPVRLVPPGEISAGEAPGVQHPADRPAARSEAALPVLQPRVTVIQPAPPPARREAPAPTIQVSIGRIEVRATTASKAPARERPSAPAAVNLDDYLRRRAKGGEG